MLARLVGLLAPDGGLWIATPNAQSFLFATAQSWSRDADFPRHRQIFSQAALVALLQAAGLQPRFHRPPRLNALLNALGTLRNVRRDRTSARWRRALAILRTLLALARLGVDPQGARDPEWVVSCHRPLSK